MVLNYMVRVCNWLTKGVRQRKTNRSRREGKTEEENEEDDVEAAVADDADNDYTIRRRERRKVIEHRTHYSWFNFQIDQINSEL